MQKRRKQPRKRDMTAEYTFIEFTKGFDAEKAEQIRKREMRETILELIEEAREEKAAGRTFDASLSIMIDLDDMWMRLQRARHWHVECDNLDCKERGKNFNLCYTREAYTDPKGRLHKNFKSCELYEPPTGLVPFIGKKYSMSGK